VPPAIDRYLQIRAAAAAGHLPSGALGYLSDVTGIVQLWIIRADGLHEQLSFGRERVTAATASPTQELFLIARDAGGNERHGLFRLDAAWGDELALTDNPDAMHVPGAFSPDGAQVAFTHTGRNGTDFDLAVVGVDGGGRRELAQPGGYCDVCDWSDDGILLRRLNTPFDHDLWLADPETGDLRHLTPHDGEVQYETPRLLAGGAVLCLCDAEGSEFARLAELRDGQVEFLTPDDADLDAVAVDRSRTRRAWVTNRQGWAELTLDGQRVDGLPPGLYGGLHVGEDGGLTLTAAATADSSDAWSVTGGTAARRTRSGVGGLDRGSFVTPSLERFTSFDGREIGYFLYGERGGPTVLSVHGGPEGQHRPQLLPVIQYLCARGITVAGPNVRGSTGYGRSFHHLDDVEKRLDSVRDLCELARVLGASDGTRVAVMGGSYGGYMTMAAITEEPDLWSAAVNIVGIVNFVTFLERTGSYRRALREAEYGSLEHDRELLERISPIRKIDVITAPLMVVHGANDPRVPVSEAEQVVEALRARSHPVEYLRYEDEGHGIMRLANRLDCYPRIAAFLEQHLEVA
jgi:dipeptidyl aminopeptidase/acylaminoacyl peptidase